MRIVLRAQEAREKERAWLRQQTHGELDDARLVDAIAGARTVYRRRGANDDPASGEQALPKRVKFVMDISGSMCVAGAAAPVHPAGAPL